MSRCRAPTPGPAPIAASIALALAGCGYPDVRPDHCDFEVMGACVVSSVLDPPHAERQMRLALSAWDAPEDALAGWALVYGPDQIPCPTQLGSGCTWWNDERTILLETLDPACPETAPLVHEIGHVLFHDGNHSGPWWNWKREQDWTWAVVRSPGASPGCQKTRWYSAPP